MLKKTTARLMTLLIIALFLFQLVPGSFTDNDGITGHARNYGTVYISGAAHSDIFFVSRENRNTSYHNVPTKVFANILEAIVLVGVFSTGLLSYRMLADHRREIKQAIPHYFHGSKYKQIHSAI